jgi:hypothetical protein
MQRRNNFTFQQVTMAKPIGAWTLSFLATLKDSPWFPATAQNCSTSLELIAASRPTKRHRLYAKAFHRPISSQILPYIICRAETRTSNEANVVMNDVHQLDLQSTAR